MATETARRRARSALARLARADMDNDTFRHEAAAVLCGAIGVDWWCWVLVDPASGLPTRAISVNAVPDQNQRRFARLIAGAWSGDGAPGVWRNQPAVTALSAATGGDLHRDLYWREMLGPAGGGDALTARLVADGNRWAELHLGRDSSGSAFRDDECAFIAEVAPLLAVRLRDGLRRTSQHDEPCPEPGIIVVDGELSVVAATDQAWRWIDRLGLERPSEAEPLPGFIYAIAARVAASATGPSRTAQVAGSPTAPPRTARIAPLTAHPPRTVRVRLQAADGRWVVVQAAPLAPFPGAGGAVAGAGAGYAITLEPARSDDLAPLLMRAWALSPRERDVARLVIDGLSTEDIAAALFVSPHTVRAHLKSVFGKVGIHRSRDLAAALAGASAPSGPRQP